RHLGVLRDEFHAEFTPNFERNTARIETAAVAAEVQETAEGFSVSVGPSAGDAPPAALTAAIAAGRDYVEAGNRIFLLDHTRAARVGAVQSALAGEPTALGGARQTHRVSAARAAEIDDLLEELAPGFQSPSAWRERSRALRD